MASAAIGAFDIQPEAMGLERSEGQLDDGPYSRASDADPFSRADDSAQLNGAMWRGKTKKQDETQPVVCLRIA